MSSSELAAAEIDSKTEFQQADPSEVKEEEKTGNEN